MVAVFVDSDVCLSENLFVSGNHCFIEKDTETGIVWLHDTSTNGTFINGAEKKLFHQKTQLKHGDEIYIVNRKDYTTHNIAFMFQDMEELKREESLISNSSLMSGDMNLTQTYNALLEDSSPDYGLAKRELSVDDTNQPDSKHRRGSSHDVHGTSVEVAPSVPGSLFTVTDKSQVPLSSAGNVVDIPSDIQPGRSLASTAGGSVTSEECQLPVTLKDVNRRSPDGTLSASAPVTQPVDMPQVLTQGSNMSSQASEPPKEGMQSSDAPTVTSSSQDEAKTSTSNMSEQTSSSDEILESLQCVICQEILYKCIRSVVHTSCTRL